MRYIFNNNFYKDCTRDLSLIMCCKVTTSRQEYIQKLQRDLQVLTARKDYERKLHRQQILVCLLASCRSAFKNVLVAFDVLNKQHRQTSGDALHQLEQAGNYVSIHVRIKYIQKLHRSPCVNLLWPKQFSCNLLLTAAWSAKMRCSSILSSSLRSAHLSPSTSRSALPTPLPPHRALPRFHAVASPSPFSRSLYGGTGQGAHGGAAAAAVKPGQGPLRPRKGSRRRLPAPIWALASMRSGLRVCVRAFARYSVRANRRVTEQVNRLDSQLEKCRRFYALRVRSLPDSD